MRTDRKNQSNSFSGRDAYRMTGRLLGWLLAVGFSSGLHLHGMQPPQGKAWFGVALPSDGVNSPESIYRAREFGPMPILARQGRESSSDIKGKEIFQYVRDLAPPSLNRAARPENRCGDAFPAFWGTVWRRTIFRPGWRNSGSEACASTRFPCRPCGGLRPGR